ncbi:protein phosphatase CheZ [Magnetovibrio sp. PR-2]|uniref:protein phosphatase CheZ n=1 Tax=Magnetovibrio sp. PR-2 TaxID=3120356 RepID=UPI002FCE2535
MSDNITKGQYVELSRQIVQLYEYMERIKAEIAAVKHPNASVDHFNKAADQLDAIVQATEEATNTIMEATESTSELVEGLRKKVAQEDLGDDFDHIIENSNKVFEACTFQDITGQRISKIVKTMNLLEGTLSSLVVIIGKDSIAALPVAEVKAEESGGVVMDGPALEGDTTVSQADIDALFD